MIKEILKKFIPSFLLSWYHFLLAFLGAFLYSFPSRELTVIGVTGTNGKSTVINLASKILEGANFKVGWISSLSLKIGEREWLNPYHMTMPGRFFIQRFLRKMVKEGCQYAVLEVTSEGIKQYRHKFIDFDVAVFTNLAPEHIEAHGSFEKYRGAKGKLFQATKGIHILNGEDENFNFFRQFLAQEKWVYRLENPKSQFPISNQILNSKSQTLIARNSRVRVGGIKFFIENVEFNLKLLGKFNISNALAAICVGLSQGISLETSRKALEKIENIPGRMELVKEGQDFRIIVDLAHTPNSFEEVFKTVGNFPHNKIISVFGSAGGGRDKWKRPELGKIAAKYSDYIILTNEDPYDEDPDQILFQIKSGITKSQPSTRAKLGAGPVPHRNEVSGVGFPIPNLDIILDRREAIRKALDLAKPEDIVLILGKGAEQSMVIGSKKIPWDDREIVKEELGKIKNRQ